MKSSGTKIIIKPRLGKSVPPAPTSPNPDIESEDEAEHADPQDADVDPPQGEDHSTTKNGDAPSEIASADANEGEEGEEGDGDGDEDGDGVGTLRGKGRARGRGGRGSGTSTPRVRVRAKGGVKPRGRGKGKSVPLTIRLPGRAEDETPDEGEGTEGGKDTKDTGTPNATPAATPAPPPATEEPVEKEVPLGGGKPFRKIQGKVHVIENDEFITEDDPKGDTKIDQYGNLLGGRRFKAATFALPNRHPQRQYMLAIDAARTSGFRDSLYYFRRNLLAFKLNATQPEKDHLIEQGKLGPHLRTRGVTLITARSAYKLHGAKMIIDGKWVEDDYYESKSLEEITAKGLKPGELVGELPDPSSTYSSEAAALAAATKASLNAPSKGERSGASGIYRAGGPTTLFGGSGWGPYSDGPLNVVRKSMLNRDGVNEENWMAVAARRTGEAGEELGRIRKEALKVCGGVLEGGRAGREVVEVSAGVDKEDSAEGGPGTLKKRKVTRDVDSSLPLGVYEPHGGIVHYRTDTQPTTCRWEVVQNSDKKEVLGGTKTGNGAWALAWVDTVMELSTIQNPEPGNKVTS